MAKPPQIGVGGSSNAGSPTLSDPLIVELLDAQGLWQLAPWLGTRIEVHRPINELPTAELEFICGNGWLVNVGTIDNQSWKRPEDIFPDDQQVRIRSGRPDPSADIVLFHGRVAKWTLAGNARGRRGQLALIDLADELDCDLDRHLHGQCMLRASSERFIADPSGVNPGQFSGDRRWTNVAPRLIDALDCVFNPDGAPNCRAQLLEVPIAPAMGGAEYLPVEEHLKGTAQLVPCFTHTFKPLASGLNALAEGVTRWCWARVFLYLLYWARRDLATGFLDGMGWATQSIRFGASNGTRFAFDPAFYEQLYAAALQAVDPDALGGMGLTSPWDRALLATPNSHVLQGLSWWDALRWTCAKSGVGFVREDGFDAQGEPLATLRFFVPGAASPALHASFKLASPAFTTHDKSWNSSGDGAAVEDFNNVSALHVDTDYRQVRNQIALLGGANVYEVTLELVPGWDAVSSWDVDPSDAAGQAAALAAIGTPAWRTKYDADGAAHRLPNNYFAGRAWLLPDFAALPGLARPFGPFNAPRYELFDFATVRLGELDGYDSSGNPFVRSYEHAARPRPVGPCLTGRDRSLRFGPTVDWSLDGGATWSWLPAGVEVMRRSCRIYLTIASLADLRPASGQGAGDSFAQAYVKGKLRIRITGTIRGDDAWSSGTVGTGVSLSRLARGKLLMRRDYQRRTREDLAVSGLTWRGGNSQFRGSAHFAEEHAAQIADPPALYQQIRILDRVRRRGVVETPGISYGRVINNTLEGWRAGDEASAIYAELGAAEQDLRLDANLDAEYCVIGAVHWSFARGNGREPAYARTTMHLEDPRAFVRIS